MVVWSRHLAWILHAIVWICLGNGAAAAGDHGLSEGCFSENKYLHKSHKFVSTVDECIDACETLYFR